MFLSRIKPLAISHQPLAIFLFLTPFTLSTFLILFLVGQVHSQLPGITPAWFVTEGGDLHSNSGGISSNIPATCTEVNGCNLNHYRIKGYGPVLPGVPNTLSMPLRFGEIEQGVITCSGSCSGIGGTEFDTERIIYDYAYFERLFRDLPDCTAADEASCFRNRSWDGTSKPTAGAGIYQASGSVTIDTTWAETAAIEGVDISGNWVITGGDRIVLMIPGNVLIKTGIRFQQTTTNAGGMLAIIARDNIAFHHSIVSGQESGGVWSDTGVRVGGVYVADDQIITCANDSGGPASSSDCDGQILFGGVFVAWRGFNLGRDLGSTLNATAPSEVFVYIPEFTACLPACFKRPIHFFKERLPGP